MKSSCTDNFSKYSLFVSTVLYLGLPIAFIELRLNVRWRVTIQIRDCNVAVYGWKWHFLAKMHHTTKHSQFSWNIYFDKIKSSWKIMICFSNLFLQNQKRNFLVLGVAHGGSPWPIFTQVGLKMVIFRGFSKFFFRTIY